MKASLAAALVASASPSIGSVLTGAPIASAVAPTAVASTGSPDTCLQTLVNSSYSSLLGCVQGGGFTPTSVTGAYSGMHIRDGSVQAMAMLAAGNNSASRAMLRYGAAAGLSRAPHRVPAPSDTVSAQASQTTTSTKVASLGGRLSVTQQLSPVGAVSAFWAYLVPSAGARGPVVATLRTGTDASATNDIIDVESVDASQSSSRPCPSRRRRLSAPAARSRASQGSAWTCATPAPPTAPRCRSTPATALRPNPGPPGPTVPSRRWATA